MVDKQGKKAPTKTELDREKLTLEIEKLRRENSKNILWYLSKVALPLATFIVTTVILYNQYQIEKSLLEADIAKQFAATAKDLDSDSPSTWLSAALSMENFIGAGPQYRSQLYLLLASKIRHEMMLHADSLKEGHDYDKVLVNQICEIFRKLSLVRLESKDEPISLLLTGINLESLNLSYFDLRQAQLQNATLSRTNLQNATLKGASLYKANLHQANLQETDLQDTMLGRANLSIASLAGANLQRADLWQANLERANLEGADLRGARVQVKQLCKAFTIYEANLDSTILEGVNKNCPGLLQKSKYDIGLFERY
jgi:uncharacterized protein YjbI with pentapeptide repeats